MMSLKRFQDFIFKIKIMIVKQIGYKKLKDILQWKSEGKVFSIYKTRKNTRSDNLIVRRRAKRK